jgi:hypothetical protein
LNFKEIAEGYEVGNDNILTRDFYPILASGATVAFNCWNHNLAVEILIGLTARTGSFHAGFHIILQRLAFSTAVYTEDYPKNPSQYAAKTYQDKNQFNIPGVTVSNHYTSLLLLSK